MSIERRTRGVVRWFPIALLLVAFAMRVAWLADVPPGLHHDEIIYSGIAEKALAGGWSIFYPEGQGREGLYTVFLAAALKWLGTGAFALRVPSALISTLGLCAVYALTRRLFGSFVACFALAEMSVTFWTVFPGRVAMRAVTEPLVAALAAWALWQAIQTANRSANRQVGNPGFIAAGVLIGLTVYTYRGARALPGVLVLLPLYLVLFDRAMLKRIWRGLTTCAIVAVVAAAPLVIFLNAHPGIDQLGWAGRDQALQALRAGDVRPALRTTVATLGAFFVRGDPDDYYNLGGRPVFEPVTGALFAAGVLIALRRIKELRYAYLLLWLGLALAPGMVSEPAPHFYRIIGAQVTAFIFPGIALSNIKSQVSNFKWRAHVSRLEIWYLIFAALIILDGASNAHDYFITWGRKETVRVLWNKPMAEIASYLDHSEEHTPVAICTLLINRREEWLRPAPVFFHFLMHRDSGPLRFYDCRYSLVLPNGGAETRYAFPGTAPIDRFLSRFLGEWLKDAKPIEGVPLSKDNALVLQDPHAALAQKIDALAPTVENMPADFGHVLELWGYEMPKQVGPGQPIVLVTWWRVKQTPAMPNLTMFVHLLRSSHDERILAQQDLMSVMADTLQPGDVFAQIHEFVVVPPDALPGDYPLTIGLYDADTGKRLPVYYSGSDTSYTDQMDLPLVRVR